MKIPPPIEDLLSLLIEVAAATPHNNKHVTKLCQQQQPTYDTGLKPRLTPQSKTGSTEHRTMPCK